jgi:PAS domain S-box-containing protein
MQLYKILLVGYPTTGSNLISTANSQKADTFDLIIWGRQMYVKKENIDTLVGLGLNGTQARICLALAVNETSTLREISEASGVARPDTYRALLELEKKGLVEKIVSFPTKYKLLSLREVLSILVGRREKESLELQERLAKLLNEYEKIITNEQTAGDNQFVLVPSGKAFSNRLKQLIQDCQKSICLIASQKELIQFFAHHLKMLEKEAPKKVTIRITTEKRRNDLLARSMFKLQKKANLETRYIEILPRFTLVTFDEKEVLVLDKAQRAHDNAAAVYSNNSSLVELAQSYFNDAWFSASESPHQEFKRDKLQFDYLFANMINGFAYCKMIFDDECKPVDFVYLQVNDAFERITGLTRGQVIGKRATRVRPGIEKTNPELFQTFGRVSRSGKAEEIEVFYQPLNRWRRISVYSPKRGYFALVFEDITERKKAEKALLEKQQELNLIFDSSPTIIFYKDTEGKITQANRSFAETLKTSKEELLNKTVFELYSPKIAQAMTNDDIAVLKSKHSKMGIIEPYESPTGLRWIRTSKIPTFDGNGNVNGLIGFSEDITERKKAEDELKQRYDFLESLGENVNAGLAIVNRKYNLVWANKMLRDVGACPGEQCYQTLAHANMVCSDCGAKKIFDQNVLLDVHEYQHIRPNGEAYWVELRVTPLKDENGNITAALELAVPINERKKAEAEREEMIEFLKIANAATSTRDLIKASADLFQKQSGCEAVGIRLKEDNDYPYYETRGFPPEHVRLENRLCAIDEAGCPIRDFKGDPVLECMCGNVICGRFDPSKKFFTAKGSFWTNSTTELLASTTEENRQARTRNRCNGEGYESVALLALRVGDDRLGLLQLNDKRKNIFTLETIQTWEIIADHLALALSKTITEESLRKIEQRRAPT